MEVVSALAVLSAVQDASSSQASLKLRALGFEVYPGGPFALTINAPRDRFEQVFGVRLEVAQDGQVVSVGPAAVIPPGLAPYIDRIEFPTRHETFP